MPKPRLLRVIANPYAHLDHEGRPAAAYPCDPIAHTPDRRHVGAVHKSEVIELRDPAKGDTRKPLHDIWFEFSDEPQTLPDTPHYRQGFKVHCGEYAAPLIAADAATAKAVGVPFRDPAELLAAAKAEAAKRWAAAHDGELPSFAAEEH